MATEVKMPQLGETVVEGTITKWLKQEGDSVQQDELLVEISTDKVDSEVPSTAAGTLQKILVQEGDTVKVGTAIAVIGEDGEAGGDGASAERQQEGDGAPAEARRGGDGASAEAQQDDGDGGAEASPRQQGDDGAAPEAGGDDEVAAKAAEEKGDAVREAQESRAEGGDGAESEPAPGGDVAPEPSAQAHAPARAPSDTSKRGIISPLVRRLADEHDVDLDAVEGTGSGGRIRKQDVLRHVEERKAQPAAAAPARDETPAPARDEAPAREPAEERRPAGREELVAWTNIRRRTAEHMVASHLETARAWNAVEADWTRVVALREQAKAAFAEREGFNLTYLPFLAKAVCETLLEMPEVNSTFDEENQGNVVKHYVNLGIAVALEGGGLIVPVVKGADERNLVGLARGINDVVTKARTKKLTPDDLAGGTFTITNPGPFGSVVSVPIIPRGQTAILGFEAIQKRVVVTDDDTIGIRSMGFLSMSWDHRAIDGAEAARFLARLRERIETTDFAAELGHYV